MWGSFKTIFIIITSSSSWRSSHCLFAALPAAHTVPTWRRGTATADAQGKGTHATATLTGGDQGKPVLTAQTPQRVSQTPPSPEVRAAYFWDLLLRGFTTARVETAPQENWQQPTPRLIPLICLDSVHRRRRALVFHWTPLDVRARRMVCGSQHPRDRHGSPPPGTAPSVSPGVTHRTEQKGRGLLQRSGCRKQHGHQRSVSASGSDHSFRGKPAAKPWAALCRSPRGKEPVFSQQLPSEPGDRRPRCRSSAQGPGALADRLAVTSWETLTQNFPAELLPNSWPWGTVRK